MNEAVASTESKTEPPSEPKRSPGRRWLRRGLIAGQIVLGLGLGLFVTEKVFASRDEGAFPHVNFYVEDAALGVRLEPGASMNFRFRDNPKTTIHVNAQGYRGADWAEPGQAGEIIVLGDSQVFGLGVEDSETFSAVLAELSQRPVLNAGVPTYGPPEYLALAAELLEARKPATLVVTMNFLNDPFELERPNGDRHAVWDGWAVRAEHAPSEVKNYPGRKWLYSQSHAMYAFRRWYHARDEGESGVVEGVDFGTPSEGSYEDLVGDSHAAHAAREGELSAAEQALDASRERVKVVDAELRSKRDTLDELVREFSEYEYDDFDAEIAAGQPGDIVEEDFEEESRSILLTAGLIRKAARERERYLDKLLRKQERKGKSEAKDLVEAEVALRAERAALRLQIASGVPLVPPPQSVFDAYLSELQELCAAHGTELVVIALPVDVQVDPSEWDKYGVEERPDMSESLVLLTDFVTNAEQLGARGLDATAALQGAEPGAFLNRDIHMTPKGHAALAAALAETLEAPLAVKLPGTGLPEGRTFAPVHDDWNASDEVRVKGSSKAGCLTMIRNGWFRVVCARKRKRDGFGGLELLEGGDEATMAFESNDGLSLVTPLIPGSPITARFHFKRSILELQVRWAEGEDGKPSFVGEFVAVDGAPRALAQSEVVDSLCASHFATHDEVWCADQDEYDAWNCEKSCGGLWADVRLYEACRASEPEGATLLACVQNDPLVAPSCQEGSVHAFATNHCYRVCDDNHACESGTCTPWQGGGVCVGD